MLHRHIEGTTDPRDLELLRYPRDSFQHRRQQVRVLVRIQMRWPDARIQNLPHLRGEFVKLVRQNDKTGIFITHQINEAIFLADRVAVLSSRPGRLKKVFDVPFDRPRTLALKRDPRFLELEDEIWKLIEEESDRMGMVVEETV